VVVEDGSSDKTCSIVNSFCLSDSRVKLLSLTNHLGKGGSIVAAALHFAISANKEYVAYMDVDLAADPSELIRLLENIKDHDIAVGSRILRGDLPPIKRPLYRSVLSRCYSKLFRTMFRVPIYDPQCGFKLFRLDIVPSLFKEVIVNGFAFDSGLVVNAYSQGLRIKEVPINWRHGKSSTVSIINEIQSMGLDLLSIWYTFHSLWLQNRPSYPQKKGSIYGKLLFALLSLNHKITTRRLQDLEQLSNTPNLEKYFEQTGIIVDNPLQKQECQQNGRRRE
jgi:glycosyltransferase involved in cell wall biosynthesis